MNVQHSKNEYTQSDEINNAILEILIEKIQYFAENMKRNRGKKAKKQRNEKCKEEEK